FKPGGLDQQVQTHVILFEDFAHFYPGGGGTMPTTITETTSETKFDLAAIQQALRENKFDGWLFYDHHHRDPLAYSILGLDPNMHVTRRWFYFIPAIGDPKKLVHRIES